MDNQKKKWVYTPKKITFLRSIGYGLNDIGGGLWGTLVASYLMFFLTTYAGLSPAAVGTILLVGKMIDVFVAIFLGTTSDNFYRTKFGRKFGRRHSFLLITIIINIIFMPALFIVVPGSFLWYLVAYVMINTASMLGGVGFEPLATEMTDKAEKRVKMSSVRMFVSAFGTFAATALPAMLLSALGSKTATAYTISGIVFGLTCAICTLITYRSTWEYSPEYVKKVEGKEYDEPTTKGLARVKKVISEYWKVWKNKSARYTVSIYFITYFAKDCYSATFLYYIVFVLGLSQSLGQSVLSLSFVALLTIPLASWMLVRFRNPKLTWKTAFVLMLFAYVVYAIIGMANFKLTGVTAVVVLFALGIIWQVGREFQEYTVWQVIALVPDVDTVASSHLRAGTFGALQTFTRQTTGAAGSFLVGWALTLSGFSSSATNQTSLVKIVIAILLIVVPIVCIMFSWYLVSKFNLNQDTHHTVKDEINRLTNGGSKQDVDPHTKDVVEDLTGYSYDQVWDQNN